MGAFSHRESVRVVYTVVLRYIRCLMHMVRGTGTVSDGVRVLVVDDDPAVATLARDYLERAGAMIDSHVETDPRAALDAIDSDIDVVVSDFEMPRMNGLELLDAMDVHVPFVLFTGSTDATLENGPATEQVDAIVEKHGRTDDYERLVETVRNVV